MKPIFASLILLSGHAIAQSLVVPVLKTQVPDFTDSLSESSRTIDLTTFFGTAEIRDDLVRLTATYDRSGTAISSDLDFLLFKNLAPLTVENLLGYVDRGDYVNMFIHRTEPGFVIQGGGFKVIESDPGVSFDSVETQPDVVNEFNVSNTLGTLAMAKTGASPDSATSQWFVSTGENSDNLDFQNGGFTVFGRISKTTLPNAQTVNSLDHFLRANFGGAFASVPLEIESSPQTLNIDDFFRFDSATQVPVPATEAGSDPTLIYRLVSGTGSASISAELLGTSLEITYTTPTAGDSKTFVVEIEDSVGNIVKDTFVVSLENVESYSDWRAATFTGGDATDDAISGPLANPDGDPYTNLQTFAHGLDLTSPEKIITLTNDFAFNELTLSYPVRKNLGGARIIPERSYDLNQWARVPAQSSTDFGDTVDTVTLTIAQDEANFPAAFYRLRVTTD